MYKTKYIILACSISLMILGNVSFNLYAQNTATQPIVVKSYAQYAADFSNDEILMGSSHNVFVGKVLRQVGNKERGIGPETQFEVEVVDNIKGDLHGIVIVDQQGGLKDGKMFVVGDDIVATPNGTDYLLQSGETYLLATRYNETENWYTLNFHPNASKLISKDKNADKTHLKELAANDDKVKKLKEAYKNEIVLDADIQHGNARNSFKSVEEKKQQELIKEKEVKINKPEDTNIESTSTTTEAEITPVEDSSREEESTTTSSR